MAEHVLLSSAYLPPVEYLAYIYKVSEVLIEKEENYPKQTYRNRCYILSPHGRLTLTVPVYQGSIHKTPIKDVTIDYSKRWQQVHLRAMMSSYNASPYFQYYFDIFESTIMKNHKYLLDLNFELLEYILKILKIDCIISYSTDFKPIDNIKTDLRYSISPKESSLYIAKEYIQVFNSDGGFVRGLSIIDLIFNNGPDSVNYF